MYKLFYAEKSASMGVRVLLEEIGAPYELIETSIDRNQDRSPQHLAVNPNGWVPVLLWNNHAMYECAAITLHLCERHPEANLAPTIDDSTRGLFLQTLVYFSNSVQNAYQMTYYPDRFATETEHESSAIQRGIRRLEETWDVINHQIGDNQWVLGQNFSAADIYLFMLTTWLRAKKGHPAVSDFNNVHRIAREVAKRPSVQLVYKPWFEDPEY